MIKATILATALMFVAGASLAVPSRDVPMPATQLGPPTVADYTSPEALANPFGEEMAAEPVQVARKARSKGGKRGGAKRKRSGGFKAGNKRQALRGGEPGRPGRIGDPGGLRGGEPGRPGRIGDPGGLRGGEPGRPGRPGDPGGIRDVDVRGDVDVRRDVDVDRDVYVGDDVDFDDDDDELGAALMGGVIGLGIGAALSQEPAE